MMKKQQMIVLALLCLLLIFIVGTAVLAQTSAGFNLEWYVIGNGGTESNSASYQVNGTMGQGLASLPTSDSASFSASSGYWVLGPGTFIYLPIVNR